MRKCVIVLLFLILSSSAQVPEVPRDDNKVYYGLGYGAAGILDVLILGRKSSDSVKDSVDMSFLKESLSNLWNLGSENNSLEWTKTTEDRTYWTGMKYGQEGIAKVFLDFSTLLDPGEEKGVWLGHAEEILNTRMAQLKLLPPNVTWGYSFINLSNSIGIPINGIDFGASGVLMLSIDLYEQTVNRTYLEYAETIAQRIIATRNQTLPFPMSDAIPWFRVSGFVSEYVLGYSRGMSGMFPLLYKLSLLTGNDTYAQVADEQVNVILSLQNSDGSWPIVVNGTEVTLGFDEGVAGILYALSQYADMTNTSVSTAVQRGLEYLSDRWEDNTGFLDPLFDGHRNSLASGLAGIIYALSHIKLPENIKNIFSRAVDLFYSKFVTYSEGNTLLTVFERAEADNVFDLSLKEGLAGALFTLLNLPDEYRHGSRELTGAVSSTLRGLQEDLLWPRQIEGKFYWKETDLNLGGEQPDNSLGFLIVGLLLVLMVLVYIRSSKSTRR